MQENLTGNSKLFYFGYFFVASSKCSSDSCLNGIRCFNVLISLFMNYSDFYIFIALAEKPWIKAKGFQVGFLKWTKSSRNWRGSSKMINSSTHRRNKRFNNYMKRTLRRTPSIIVISKTSSHAPKDSNKEKFRLSAICLTK